MAKTETGMLKESCPTCARAALAVRLTGGVMSSRSEWFVELLIGEKLFAREQRSPPSMRS